MNEQLNDILALLEKIIESGIRDKVYLLIEAQKLRDKYAEKEKP